MFERTRLFLVALAVAAAVSVTGAVADTSNDADVTDANVVLTNSSNGEAGIGAAKTELATATAALGRANTRLDEVTAALGASKAAAQRIKDRNTVTSPPPPTEEPPAPTGADFVGDQITDFPERVSGHTGAITEGTVAGKHAITFNVRDTDVAPATPTENPRAQLGAPAFLTKGYEGWARTEVYVPSGVTWSSWFTLFAPFYGPPYGGSGTHIEASYTPKLMLGRSRTYGEDTPWSSALPRDQWFSLLWHFKLDTAANGGYIEFFYNGVQQTLVPASGSPTTKLVMSTYDPQINGGGANNARIAAYHKLHNPTAEVHISFTGLWIGKTRASVGG